MRKSTFAACLFGAAIAAASFFPVTAQAADAPAQEAAEAAQDTAKKEATLYISKKYGYAILCPQRPLGVIPASAFQEMPMEGEVLVFANEGYNITHAWFIIKDGFSDSLPDFNKMSDKEAKALTESLQQNNGYETVQMVKITDKNKGIFGITAKDVEIDSDGDGTPDAVAHADNQMAVTFFRGNKGGRYAIRLIDNPDLREESIKEYQMGIATFHEMDEKEIKKAEEKMAKEKQQQG